MKSIRPNRWMLACLTLLVFETAQAEVPATPDSLGGRGPLPLASATECGAAQRYPHLDIGIGFRTFDPDLSGLSEAYDRTPSFGLSPLLCGIVEIALSNRFALRVDGGVSLASGESGAQHGLLGVVARLPWFAKGTLRPSLGAGACLCHFLGEESGIISEGGASGWYATAGLEYPLGRTAALEFGAGYCSFPKVSSTYPEYQSPENPGTKVEADLSGPMFGISLRWFI